MGLYTENNIFYTLTSCHYGKSYDKVCDDSLQLCIAEIMIFDVLMIKAVTLEINLPSLPFRYLSDRIFNLSFADKFVLSNFCFIDFVW